MVVSSKLPLFATTVVVTLLVVKLLLHLVLFVARRRRGNRRHISLLPPDTYVPVERDATKLVRVGIVTVTRHPIGLREWLSHHKRLGVTRVYVRVEDSPDVLEELRRAEYADWVRVTPGEEGDVSYFSIMDRQREFVDGAIRRARAEGVTHLLHIDDDELLYLPGGRDKFEAHLSNIVESSIHLENLEAVYDGSDCSNPFANTRHFRVDPTQFTAYVNGKSIANLNDEEVRSYGPHMFSGTAYFLEPHVAIILHFEGACLSRWAEKFTGYAQSSPEACARGEIPFAYYCESLTVFREASLSTDEERAAVWKRWKLRRHSRGHAMITLDPLDTQNGFVTINGT